MGQAKSGHHDGGRDVCRISILKILFTMDRFYSSYIYSSIQCMVDPRYLISFETYRRRGEPMALNLSSQDWLNWYSAPALRASRFGHGGSNPLSRTILGILKGVGSSNHNEMAPNL